MQILIHLSVNMSFAVRSLISSPLRSVLPHNSNKKPKMNRWIGKIAVVTGASSGIGASIAEHLVKAGMVVIGLARRQDRLCALKQQLCYEKGEFNFYQCDVSDLSSIKSAFSQIRDQFGRVNILVNNAGIAKATSILALENESDLESIIKTNFIGNIFCIKEMYKIMQNSLEQCHIININSVLGHSIPGKNVEYFNVYPSTKFAIRAAAEVLRHELRKHSNFRISTITPGLVKTDIAHAGKYQYADKLMETDTILQPEDVSKAVLFVIEMPQHVQISELIIKPVGEKI